MMLVAAKARIRNGASHNDDWGKLLG